jgi:hypothetical protein
MSCLLKLESEEQSVIGGIGTFGKGLDPLPVSESVANQFDNDDMRALGWVVLREQSERAQAMASDVAPSPIDDGTLDQ